MFLTFCLYRFVSFCCTDFSSFLLGLGGAGAGPEPHLVTICLLRGHSFLCFCFAPGQLATVFFYRFIWPSCDRSVSFEGPGKMENKCSEHFFAANYIYIYIWQRAINGCNLPGGGGRVSYIGVFCCNNSLLGNCLFFFVPEFVGNGSEWMGWVGDAPRPLPDTSGLLFWEIDFSLKMYLFVEALFLQKSISYGSSGQSVWGTMLVFWSSLFICSPQPGLKLSFYVKIVILASLCHWFFFHLSLPPINCTGLGHLA